MAIISLNGTSSYSKSICFTDIPNILRINETNSGTIARATIQLGDFFSSTVELTLKVNGEQIIGTNDINQAVGNRFYIPTTTNATQRILSAYSIIKALNNLSSLPINYNIYNEIDSSGAYTRTIVIEAKEPGSRFNLTIEGDMANNPHVTINKTNGSSSSTLANTESRILVDVYGGSAFDNLLSSTSSVKGKYITTLEKEFWSDDCYFNLSPLFASLSEYGELNYVNLFVYRATDTGITLLQKLENIYFTPGYSINQGVNYIPKFSNYYLAQNVSRGDNDTGYLNKTILYVFDPKINFTLYKSNTNSTITFTISYISSGQTVIGTSTQSILYTSNLSMVDVELELDENLYSKAFYVSVAIPNLGSLKYNVIKPLKATEEGQRVYWRNSYGGVSFFDFTGQRTEQRKTNVEYYQKQIFDYYQKSGEVSLNNVYDKDINITVTLNSHNIEKDGQWSLFDLQNSKQAWTIVNNKLYYITVTDIKITETSVPDIYTASISYTYNTGDTF